MLQRHTQRRLLIDCNSFFAACEVMRNPALRAKPVCVGKDIILAASYEAKAFGVYTGMPVREAKKVLPKETIYCGMDMHRYTTVSQKLVDYLRTHFTHVMPASVDESFIRCDEWRTLSDEQLEARIITLQQNILHNVGLPVSIGIAPTKLLAKMAADYRKPLGYTIVVHDYQIETLLADVSINEVPFIGTETTEKLLPYVRTALWYSELSLEQVKTILGHHGAKIRYELNAISVNITQLKRSQPWCIGRTRSFNPHFTDDPRVLWYRLQDNVTRAWKELYAKQLWTAHISILLKSRSFKKRKNMRKIPYHTNDFGLIMRTAHELFESLIDGEMIQGIEMRTTGILLHDLGPLTTLQPWLFSYEEDCATNRLNKTFFSLKKRYGKESIALGTYTAQNTPIYKKPKQRNAYFASTN